MSWGLKPGSVLLVHFSIPLDRNEISLVVDNKKTVIQELLNREGSSSVISCLLLGWLAVLLHGVELQELGCVFSGRIFLGNALLEDLCLGLSPLRANFQEVVSPAMILLRHEQKLDGLKRRKATKNGQILGSNIIKTLTETALERLNAAATLGSRATFKLFWTATFVFLAVTRFMTHF